MDKYSSSKLNGHVAPAASPRASSAEVLPRLDAPIVDTFWQAPEPRDPRLPQDYLGRVLAWFHPPLELAGEGLEALRQLLAMVAEQLPREATRLWVQYHGEVVGAAREYERLQADIRARKAARNAWIAEENDWVERHAGPARERLAQAEEALDRARGQAAEACSQAGLVVDVRQPSVAVFTAPTAELAARAEPVRRSPGGAWASWLAPLTLGAILGVALLHAAGLVDSQSLKALSMSWRALLVAWLAVGAPLYFVLGHGLRSASRSCRRWSRAVACQHPGVEVAFQFCGLALALFAAWLPLLLEAIVDGVSFHAMAVERATPLRQALAGGQVTPLWVLLLAGGLMATVFYLSEFWSEWNAESDFEAERENRLEVARQQDARLREVAVQWALEAVLDVQVAAQRRERLAAELARIEARRQAPVWEPSPAEQRRLDDARAAACGSAQAFQQRLREVVAWLEGERHRPAPGRIASRLAGPRRWMRSVGRLGRVLPFLVWWLPAGLGLGFLAWLCGLW